MFGFQAQGAAPIVRGEAGERTRRRSPRRSGSGTRRPGTRPSAAATESEGAILAVTDREILSAYRRVAREGLFAEPASAASVAGLLHLHAEGALADGRHRRVRAHGPRPEGPRVGDRRRRPPRERARRRRRRRRRAGALAGAADGPRPRDLGEPGPGVRLLRPRARPAATRSPWTRRASPASRWEGEGADELPTDGTDMVTRSMVTGGATKPGRTLPGVPPAIGEPDPAGARAGVVLGRLRGRRVLLATRLLELSPAIRPRPFRVASRLEGHPDNAAAAVFGGFTLASPDADVVRLDPHPIAATGGADPREASASPRSGRARCWRPSSREATPSSTSRTRRSSSSPSPQRPELLPVGPARPAPSGGPLVAGARGGCECSRRSSTTACRWPSRGRARPCSRSRPNA